MQRIDSALYAYYTRMQQVLYLRSAYYTRMQRVLYLCNAYYTSMQPVLYPCATHIIHVCNACDTYASRLILMHRGLYLCKVYYPYETRSMPVQISINIVMSRIMHGAYLKPAQCSRPEYDYDHGKIRSNKQSSLHVLITYFKFIFLILQTVSMP